MLCLCILFREHATPSFSPEPSRSDSRSRFPVIPLVCRRRPECRMNRKQQVNQPVPAVQPSEGRRHGSTWVLWHGELVVEQATGDGLTGLRA